MTDQLNTPADLAGNAFESTIRRKAAVLERELIRQTLEDVESWSRAVEAQWQQAHPDQVGSPLRPKEVEAFRNDVRTSHYAWVVPAFERYLRPDPDAVNPMIEALRSNESMFGGSQDNAGNFHPVSPGLARINDARGDMEQWQGDMQENFIDHFLTPLQTVSLNQAAVAKVVREQLECSKVMYIRYRKGILNLVTRSIDAVKTLNNGRDPKSYLWGTLVAVSVGAGLTLAGLEVAGAALAIAGTLGQGLIPEPTQSAGAVSEPMDLSAPTAQEIAANVYAAMTKMDRDIYEQELQVRSALRNICDTIASRSVSIRHNTSGPLSVATPSVSSAEPNDIIDGSLRPRH